MRQIKHFLLAAAVASIVPAVARASDWATDVTAGERAGYSLVYTKDLGTTSQNGGAVVYTTDNSGSPSIAPDWDRVGYYMELTSTTFGRQFVWASFDRLAGMTSAAKTGVPNGPTGEIFQQTLSNMNVESNVGGIVTGTGKATGNIEFWPNDYSQGNAIGIANANGGTFDFGDQRSNGGNHGSMQLHNNDTDGSGAGTTGQTLFAYNNWGGGNGNAVGIGTNPGTFGGDPDWTFADSAGAYSAKVLEVYVHAVPEPASLSLIGMGGLVLLGRRRRA